MSNQTMRVFRLAAPVTNLGFGRRVVLWVAGCSIGCAGCCSKDTWAAAGQVMAVEAVGRQIDALALRHSGLDGLTISGGEPTEAGPALELLLRQLRSAHPDWDVLLYSGRSWRTLQSQFAHLVALVDVVIPEPFVHKLPSQHPLLGSANQSLKLLTKRARMRYKNAAPTPRALEAAVAGNMVALSGVPKDGSLGRFEMALRRHGIALQSKSWE